jgi:alkaline phosphatase D
MREALIWVQTIDRAEVILEYTPINATRQYYSSPVYTTARTAYTAKLIADKVEPGTRYRYAIIINGERIEMNDFTFATQPLWQYRTDPPAFTLATGSCAFINEPVYDRPTRPYGGDYRIFERIADTQPDVMLWLGDNVYLREPDWNTRTGIMHRYSHARQTPELKRLLRTCPNYAIWDDHDYGPNDADRSFIHKDLTREAFELFWGNPSFGLSAEGGITTQFSFHDVDFFLLDNRWFRSNYKLNGTVKTVFGAAQTEWLIEALKYSKAPFKIVATGGQFLSDLAVYENHAQYPEERNYILRRIDEEGISGVIFLSGDRHHTELSKVTLPGGFNVYDLTCSPLTSTAYDPLKERNNNRVDGTAVGERNFALIQFSGERKNRRAEVRVFNSDGEELWQYTIAP